jgi:GT2 family glycosyltransferase
MKSDRAASFGVVVLNWNGADDTIACLDSLAAASPRADRVVVVDNGSTDDSMSRLRRWAQQHGFDGEQGWVVFIEAGTNRGFAGGNNLGIRFLYEKTDVSHVLLLNNDATIAPDFFTHIDSALVMHPSMGLVTGTIYEDPARDKVWYAGAYEIPSRALVKHKLEVPQSIDPTSTDFVTGCAMVISRRLIDEIGFLAECYFPLYWEDGEYSFRSRKAGFPVMYAPAAKVYHKVGATVGAAKQSPIVAHCQNRLRVFYVRRNYRGLNRVIALAYLAVTKPGRALVEALSGRPRIGLAIIGGTLSGFVSSSGE